MVQDHIYFDMGKSLFDKSKQALEKPMKDQHKQRGKRNILGVSAFTILVFFFLLAGFGILVIRFIPIQLTPPPITNTLMLNFYWPGASPTTIEQEVTSRLEALMATISGVNRISSRSGEGFGSIELNIDASENLTRKRIEIVTQLRLIHTDLPKGVSVPKIEFQGGFSSTPLLTTYAVSGIGSLAAIEAKTKSRVLNQFNQIPGLADIDIHGSHKKYLNIAITQNKLQQLNLNLSDIKEKILLLTNKLEIGNILINSKPFNLLVSTTQDQITHLPVAKIKDRIIYLHDIAKVTDAQKSDDKILRVNGLNTITISFYAKKEANHLALVNIIDAILEDLQYRNHGNLRFEKIFDRTQGLNEKLWRIVILSCVSLGALLMFALLFYANTKNILTLLASFLSCILITGLLFFIFKLEINLYTIAGITFSSGFVMDNIILAIKQSEEERSLSNHFSMITITLTTIIPMIVIYLLDDPIQWMMNGFVDVFVINMIISLVIASLLVPAVQCKLPDVSGKKTSPNYYNHLLAYYNYLLPYLVANRSILFSSIVFGFGFPIYLLPDTIKDEHLSSNQLFYNDTLGSDSFKNKLKPRLENFLGGSISLFHATKKEYRNYKQSNDLEIKVFIKMAAGCSKEMLENVFINFEKLLETEKNIKHFLSESHESGIGILTIYLDHRLKNSHFPYELKGKLINLANSTGNASCSIIGVGSPFSNQVIGTYLEHAIQVKASNYQELISIATVAKKRLLKNPKISVVGFSDHRTYVPSDDRTTFLTYNENIEMTKMMGTKISSYLAKLNNNSNIITINDQELLGFSFNNDQKVESIWELKQQKIDIDASQVIKLSPHVNLLQKAGPYNIVKDNQQYLLLLQFNFLGEHLQAKIQINQIVEELNKKFTYQAQFKSIGFTSVSGDQEAKFLQLIIGSIFILFFVCTVFFNSFSKAVVIISLIPVAFIGIFLSTYFFDFTFDYGGYTSFIIVSGVAINSAILISIKYYNIQSSQIGIHNLTAYRLALKDKLPTINLSMFSTLFGLLTFALFSEDIEFWTSLSICTICGLIFSWLGLLLVFPLFFNLNPR